MNRRKQIVKEEEEEDEEINAWAAGKHQCHSAACFRPTPSLVTVSQLLNRSLTHF